MNDPVRKVLRKSTAGLLLSLLLAAAASAQRPPDLALDPAINRQVVEGAIGAIDRNYVSTEVAAEVTDRLRQRLRAGDYDAITSAFDLIDALDRDLQQVSRDPHLALAYNHVAEPLVAGADVPAETAAEKAQALEAARANNFGFEKVERLPGNIGYLQLNSFVRPAFSGEATAAAMTLLAGTDALVIDLRDSHGGSADMVVFLASYFFGGDEPLHLGDVFVRPENRVQQWWTLPYVPGSRYPDRDVYILLSRRSFSAVEGFAALLQHHGRATIVGEPTRGGTHPGVFVRVHPNFAVFVPTSRMIYPTGTPTFPLGRPVHPTTRTDYRGTGITPDIDAPATRALATAHLAALTGLVERQPARREDLQPLIDGLRAELDASTPAD